MEAEVIASFVVLLLFITVMAFLVCRSKSFLSRKNFIYTLPIIALASWLYSIGYIYNGETYSLGAFFSILVSAIKCLAFEYKGAYADNLVAANPLYAFSVGAVIVLGGLTTISSLLGFAKIFIVNAFRLFFRIYGKSPIFVLGLNEEAIEFAKKDKRAVILLDKKNDSFSFETRGRLYANNIAYLRSDISSVSLSRYISYTNGKVHFFDFSFDSARLNLLTAIIEKIKLVGQHEVEFHVSVEEDNALFVNKRLAEAVEKSAYADKILATSFNLYEVLGKKWNEEYNFAEFLPRTFFDGVTILPNKRIEVVMLGAGKSSNAVLKSAILNNNFVTIEDGKFTPKEVTYHLFDINEKAFDKKIVKMFENGKKDLDISAIIKKGKSNLRGDFDPESLFDESGLVPSPNEDTFLFYFINIGSSLSNLALVNSLLERLSNDNYLIFYCVDSKDEVMDFENPRKIRPFGFKNDLLRLENISDEAHYKEAEEVHKNYCKAKKHSTPFNTLALIDAESNLASSANKEFRLNLLGFSFNKNGERVSKEEFDSIYLKGEKDSADYTSYFSMSARNALRYNEHQRWNTFYYLHDYRTMPLKDIVMRSDGEVIHKDSYKRLHACLRPYYELNEFNEYKAKLISEASSSSFEECLKEAEVYKYDSTVMDEIYKEAPIYYLSSCAR